jgi:hypothetical protein
VTFAFVRTFQGHLALAQLQLFEVLPASDFSDKLQVHPLPRLEVQLFLGEEVVAVQLQSFFLLVFLILLKPQG